VIFSLFNFSENTDFTNQNHTQIGCDSLNFYFFRNSNHQEVEGIQVEQKNPQLLVVGFAERQGLEPWRQLPVDRLAICSITTLAPLQGF
jgi:hypothetical protein